MTQDTFPPGPIVITFAEFLADPGNILNRAIRETRMFALLDAAGQGAAGIIPQETMEWIQTINPLQLGNRAMIQVETLTDPTQLNSALYDLHTFGQMQIIMRNLIPLAWMVRYEPYAALLAQLSASAPAAS